jgi:hypothetical protein
MAFCVLGVWFWDRPPKCLWQGDFVGTPVFVGGAHPDTYLVYCLAPGSPGKGRATDGPDVGIRCMAGPGNS